LQFGVLFGDEHAVVDGDAGVCTVGGGMGAGFDEWVARVSADVDVFAEQFTE
jgi:hypothetical protein